MDMWKGAFAPFRKHHGGTAIDHIDIDGDGWSYDGDSGLLTVTFNLETKYENNPEYTVEIPVENQDAQLDDEEVKELIAEQLAMPVDSRTWRPVE